MLPGNQLQHKLLTKNFSNCTRLVNEYVRVVGEIALVVNLTGGKVVDGGKYVASSLVVFQRLPSRTFILVHLQNASIPFYKFQLFNRKIFLLNRSEA